MVSSQFCAFALRGSVFRVETQKHCTYLRCTYRPPPNLKENREQVVCKLDMFWLVNTLFKIQQYPAYCGSILAIRLRSMSLYIVVP